MNFPLGNLWPWPVGCFTFWHGVRPQFRQRRGPSRLTKPPFSSWTFLDFYEENEPYSSCKPIRNSRRSLLAKETRAVTIYLSTPHFKKFYWAYTTVRTSPPSTDSHQSLSDNVHWATSLEAQHNFQHRKYTALINTWCAGSVVKSETSLPVLPYSPPIPAIQLYRVNQNQESVPEKFSQIV